MRGQSSRVPAFLLIIVLVVGFGAALWMNSSPEAPMPVIPTQVVPTESVNAWQRVLDQGGIINSTPLPTVALPDQPLGQPIVPTVVVETPVLLDAADLSDDTSLPLAMAATPTLPPTPRPTEDSDTVELVIEDVTQEAVRWMPPPLVPPINKDPQRRDHYWFLRPADSNARNTILVWYTYGSDGPNRENPFRVHHGVDIGNDYGKPVRAAGSGIVTWAVDGREEQTDIFQNSPSYGNVIRIEHDFSYEGQTIYTLYAHLSAALVEVGQRVEAGDVIGLIGDSGRVSGPHVHFEVRLGEDAYRATYNPVLWMVPFVGHGVIAGRVVDEKGNFIDDIDVTVRNRATTQVLTSTTYVFQGTGSDVNPDPRWRENFAVADVPVGRYDVIVSLNGQRIVKQVEVIEGMTSFVELSPPEPVTPESSDESGSGG